MNTTYAIFASDRRIRFVPSGAARFPGYVAVHLNNNGLIDHEIETGRPSAAALVRLVERHRWLELMADLGPGGFRPTGIYGRIAARYFEEELLPLMDTTTEGETYVREDGMVEVYMSWGG